MADPDPSLRHRERLSTQSSESLKEDPKQTLLPGPWKKEPAPHVSPKVAFTNDIKSLVSKGNKGLQSERKRWKRAHRSYLDYMAIALPAINWIRTYNVRKQLVLDLLAGLAVASMVVPQGMSYASNLAHLPQVYGLYTAFVPCIIYGSFGSSKQLAIGPVAVVSTLMGKSLTDEMPSVWKDDIIPKKPYKSKPDPKYNAAVCAPLLDDLFAVTGQQLSEPQYKNCKDAVFTATQNLYNKYAVQTAFVVGILQFLLGFLRLGWLTNFLSHSVISGFTSGAAWIIGLGQMGDVLGYPLEKKDYVWQSLYYIFKNIGDTVWQEVVMSIAWLTILIGFQNAGRFNKKLWWLRVIGPLTVTVISILTTVIGNAAHGGSESWIPYKVVGKVPEGLPSSSAHLQASAFSDFSRIWKAVLVVTASDLIESISLAKSMGRRNGYRVNSNTEYRALGLMNILGSLFYSYPATGSFSRTAVNNSVGASSPLSTFTVGWWVALTLLVITPIFKYMPKNALACIIISGVLTLFEWRMAVEFWKVNKRDFLLWLVAFVTTMMLGVDIGLGISVGLAILIVILESAFPHTAILGRIPDTAVYRNLKQYPYAERIRGLLAIRLDAAVYFANAYWFHDRVIEYADDWMDDQAEATQAVANASPASASESERSAERDVSDSPPAGCLHLPGVDPKDKDVSALSAFAYPPPADSAIPTAVGANPSHDLLKYIVLDLSPVTRIDATGAAVFRELHEDLRRRGITLALVNPNKIVTEILDRAQVLDTVGRDLIFVRMHDAVQFLVGATKV